MIELKSPENLNFLGIHEEQLDKVLFDFCRYYNGAKDENDIPEESIKMYETIKSIENHLNNVLTNKSVFAKIFTDCNLIEEDWTYQSLPESFGKLNEEYLTKIMNKEFKNSIVSFPNGTMNFPDITFNGLPMDFKAVKCEIQQKTIKISYSNAIDSIYEVEKRLYDYFYNNISSDLTNSFLIFTYYDEYEDTGKVRFLHFKIMPTLYCIKINNQGELQVKSAGELDSDGNHPKIKNSNVCVRVPSVDKKDEDKLNVPSIEEKLLMLKNAISRYAANIHNKEC